MYIYNMLFVVTLSDVGTVVFGKNSQKNNLNEVELI